MNENMSRGAGSVFGGNQKNITIAIIVLVALGFGFFLFKISPKQPVSTGSETFDLSKVKDLAEPLPVTEADHIQGSPNAKNTLLAFEDFQCPACGAINGDLKKVVAEFPDTKLVFRHYPLTQIHRNAAIAAYAAEAAAAQGKFWEMKDKLYENQGFWSDLNYPEDKFLEYAKELGVGDLEKFKADIEQKTYKNKVEDGLVEALSLKLEGTPTLIFNGHKLQNMGIEGLKKQAEGFFK